MNSFYLRPIEISDKRHHSPRMFAFLVVYSNRSLIIKKNCILSLIEILKYSSEQNEIEICHFLCDVQSLAEPHASTPPEQAEKCSESSTKKPVLLGQARWESAMDL